MIQMTVLTGCLNDIKLKNGVLIEWNPVDTKRIKGLPEYILSSGLWRFIAAASDVNPNFKFKETDYEGVVAERVPWWSQDAIAFEAGKLSMLVLGWLRVLRKDPAKIPRELCKAIARAKASNRGAKEFAIQEIEMDDESLESMEGLTSIEYTSGCHCRAPVSLSGENQSQKKCEPEKKQHEPEKKKTSYYINEQQWAIRSSDQEPAIDTQRSGNGNTRFIWHDGDEWVCNELEYGEYFLNRFKWAVRSSDQVAASSKEKQFGNDKTMFIWEDGDQWACNQLVFEEVGITVNTYIYMYTST